MSDSCLKVEEANCADYRFRNWYRIFSSEWGNARSILIKWCKSELPEYSRSSDAQTDWIRSLVAAGDLIFLCSFSNQQFWLFLCIYSHLLFSENNTSLYWAWKFSWIRRKVYFDAIIIVSNLLLDFLKETLIVGKPFKMNIFLMASCLFYIKKFLFFVLAGLQAYSLALYPAKYKTKRWFVWIGRPVLSCNCSKVLHHFRRKRNYSGYLLFGRAILLVS